MTVPPHDLQAESSVLGGVFLDNGSIADVLARGVDAGEFYHPTHRDVFAAMVELYDGRRPIDIVTVSDWMQRAGGRKTADYEFLAELAAKVPTVANIGHYAKIVHDKAALRRFILASSEATAKAYEHADAGNVENFLQEQTDALLATVAQRSRILDAKATSDAVTARYGASDDAGILPTGLRRLDRYIGGLRKRRLVVLGGRTSHGKSTLAQVMIYYLASQGIPVGVFSLEEEGVDYAEAMVVRMARRMFGDRWNAFDEATRRSAVIATLGDWRKLPIYVCEERRLSMRDISRKSREMKSRHGIQALFVDYLGLVRRPGRRKEHEELEDNIAEFNALAQIIDVAPVLLCQVNREAEKQVSRDPSPKIWQLQGAGAIEQCAWVVLLVYRPCVQDPQADGNIVQIIVGKNKRGRIGATRHQWVASIPDIRDLPDDYQTTDVRDQTHWQDRDEEEAIHAD